MNYYYNINGETKGPVSLETLNQLAAQGIIDARTPVIEEGGQQWRRFGTLGAQPVPAYSAPRPNAGAHAVSSILSLNSKIDALLSKVFSLPKFVPTNPEEQREKLASLGNINSLVVWICYIICGISYVCVNDNASIPICILVAILVGFIVQYILYMMYKQTSYLLLGEKIELSSMSYPRIFGVLFMLCALGVLLLVFQSRKMYEVFFFMGLMLIPIVATYVCFNADKLFVDVRKKCATPGRDFNNLCRFIIRSILLVVQILTPVIAVIATLALVSAAIPAGASDDVYSRLSAIANFFTILNIAMFCINLPIVVWAALCSSSWILDLYESFFSISAIKQKLDNMKKTAEEDK